VDLRRLRVLRRRLDRPAPPLAEEVVAALAEEAAAVLVEAVVAPAEAVAVRDHHLEW
jgi:hypothetical protein